MNEILIKIYRIISLIFSSFATIFILIEIHDLLIGYSSIDNSEDLSILFFVIVAIYFSISFSIETYKHLKKTIKDYSIIDKEEIKKRLKEKKFNKSLLFGNLIIGIIIVIFVIFLFTSEPISEFHNDYIRLISILILNLYGLIQIHFSLIVLKEIKKRNL